MPFQFTHPLALLLLPAALAWVLWLTWRSDAHLPAWRRWLSTTLRVVVVVLLVLAIAGLQWLKPQEGINVFFLLDRSDSIPSSQQEAARALVGRMSLQKEKEDKAGILIFGTSAAIESTPLLSAVDEEGKVYAVVDSERTDIAAAIRLGSAAFPETGQKRLVLISDGNENLGDAYAAAMQARSTEVSIDVVPIGVTRSGDVSVQKLSLPASLKQGQPFEVKIFAQADQPQDAAVRLFLNDELLGQQRVQLEPGKNLFTFPQTLDQPGFYAYDVRIESLNDSIPQNNRAISFSSVRGNPRVIVVSSEPSRDANLVAALQSSNLEVILADISRFPGTLAEMQSYDAIVLCNVAAGDLGDDLMRLLESAVRDFGVGLVCIGGDQALMDNAKKKARRFPPLVRFIGPFTLDVNGTKTHEIDIPQYIGSVRIMLVAAHALGPQDEMGVLLWDGRERWLFDLQKVGDKTSLRREIQGMNQGDLPSFQGLMTQAHQVLSSSRAGLKHVIVFSDGDPGPPASELMAAMVGDRITTSTVLIAGHAGPEIMIQIADQGRGRFYNVTSPLQLPQIFIKEAAVVLKSAIHEEPFRPQVAALSELTRGIGAGDYPALQGYVATSQKPRAETPLFTDKGDPLLAHWQYGLGRAVAFTSDAQARWAAAWLNWEKYRQFWSQTVNWSLRKLDDADLAADVSLENGEAVLSVEALDAQGNFRNFLNLQATVVSPKGERELVRLQQTGPGHYEARFPTRDEGAYLLNLAELENGQHRASTVVGASVNYSPEFAAGEPHHQLLRRIAEATGGRVLRPDQVADNPFQHNRRKTFQPRDLFEWLLRFAILLFPIDVGVRRLDIDRTEWAKAMRTLRRWLLFWQKDRQPTTADESLAALLARRDQVRARQAAVQSPVTPAADLFRPAREIPADSTPDSTQPSPASTVEVVPTPPPAEESKGAPASTASRLLEAKRRAQDRQRKKGSGS